MLHLIMLQLSDQRLEGVSRMTETAETPNEDDWKQDFEHFVHGRRGQVQAAAQQWLMTMTGLLGLFSVAVVVGGSTTINGVDDIPRWVVVVFAGVVYLLALVAELEGVRATHMGLGLRPATDAERKYADGLRRLQQDAQGPEAQCKQRKATEHLKQTYRDVKREERNHCIRKWVSRNWSPPPLIGGPEAFKDRYELQTNTLRTRLHRSRTLGAYAAVASGRSPLRCCSSRDRPHRGKRGGPGPDQGSQVAYTERTVTRRGLPFWGDEQHAGRGAHTLLIEFRQS